MCIIIACEKGVDIPSENILKTCWDNNNGGAGIMYNHNNKVYIKKGLMTFHKFISLLQDLQKQIDLKECSCVLHFRIPTSGNRDKGNCHPFPITDSISKLRETRLVENEVAVVHNGRIPMYDNIKDILCDTQLFIQNIIYVFYEYDKKFFKNNRVIKVLEKLAKSKLCFLDRTGYITKMGDFHCVEGVYYSNNSYLFSENDFYTKPMSINYDNLYTDAIYDMEEQYVDNKEFWQMYNRLITLEEGEVCYSADYMNEYCGDSRGAYAYDPSNGNFYEVDIKNERISYIDIITF